MYKRILVLVFLGFLGIGCVLNPNDEGEKNPKYLKVYGKVSLQYFDLKIVPLENALIEVTVFEFYDMMKGEVRTIDHQHRVNQKAVTNSKGKYEVFFPLRPEKLVLLFTTDGRLKSSSQQGELNSPNVYLPALEKIRVQARCLNPNRQSHSSQRSEGDKEFEVNFRFEMKW